MLSIALKLGFAEISFWYKKKGNSIFFQRNLSCKENIDIATINGIYCVLR